MRPDTPDFMGELLATGQAVEVVLRGLVTDEVPGCAFLKRAAEKATEDVGVRLIPYLVRCGYEAGGTDFERVVDAAAAVDVLKSSALVMDDVIDQSPRRNRNGSLYSQYGVERTVCVGAWLTAAAIRLLSNNVSKLESGPLRCDPVARMASIEQHIYVGQLMDLEMEGDVTVGEERYLDMIRCTTASVIQGALVIGGMLWNAPRELIKKLEQIGDCLGMAYQLRDDVVDVTGDPALTGKERNADIRRRKMRLPLVHALQNGNPRETAAIRQRLQERRPLADEEVAQVVALVAKEEGVEHTVRKAEAYCAQARQVITTLEESYGRLGSRLACVVDLLGTFDAKT